MKKCSCCLVEKEPSEFPKDKTKRDGLNSKCSDCNRARLRAYHQTESGIRSRVHRQEKFKAEIQAATRKWWAARPERLAMVRRVSKVVYEAVKRGQIIRPATCQFCNQQSGNIHAAHEDYSKPLEIKWLCPSCHAKWDHDTPKSAV